MRASLIQLSGAGVEPRHTDRPLNSQQNRNHAPTNKEPIRPMVPIVPGVPIVPKATFCWVPSSPDGAFATAGTLRNSTLGSSGKAGTPGTVIVGAIGTSI